MTNVYHFVPMNPCPWKILYVFYFVVEVKILCMTKWQVTVYPMTYAHGFCFAVLCCGYTLTDFPISIRLTSLALWQSNDCPSASKATLMNMDKYFMWIHYERLHNHNKAKHNKTVCIFLGIYCRPFYQYGMISIITWISNFFHSKVWDETTYYTPRGLLVSPCPCVHLWTESCVPWTFLNTCKIHFIFAHLIEQLAKVCCV